jgi:hypothetical protein
VDVEDSKTLIFSPQEIVDLETILEILAEKRFEG